MSDDRRESDARWAELGPIAQRRREELRLTRKAVMAEPGAPSDAALRAFETGKMPHPTIGKLGPDKRRALERLYGWKPESIDKYVRGGEIEVEWELVRVPTTRLVQTDEGPALAMVRSAPVDYGVQTAQIALLAGARDAMRAFEEGHGSIDTAREKFWRLYNTLITEYARARGESPEAVLEMGRALLDTIDQTTGVVGIDRR
ncbi:hypothetical protein [Nocardia terpenica]|nr:hypothetical protein [Nocardia terpenica]NQE89726.1 hypothetical protein [Nocardia terpenica]